VRFLALSMAEDPRVTRAAAHRLGFDWPLAQSARDLLGPLGVTGVPATVVIDDGRVVAIGTGEQAQAWVEAEARRLR
jgi:hypothetical protein